MRVALGAIGPAGDPARAAGHGAVRGAALADGEEVAVQSERGRDAPRLIHGDNAGANTATTLAAPAGGEPPQTSTAPVPSA